MGLSTPGGAVPLPRLLALLLPPAFSMYAIFQGAQIVLLPVQMEALDPVHKLPLLATLTTLCSATSVAGLVMGGAVSDATLSRWGRRLPWFAGMGCLSGLLLVAVGRAASLSAVMAETALLWFTLNFFQAALLAVIPDRVAPGARALASWAFGFSGPIGVLIGVNIAASVAPGAAYALLASLLVVSSALFVTLAPEAPSRAGQARPCAPAKPGGWRQALARLGESFADHDFVLVFAARSLLFLAQYMVGGYLFYALQDYVGAAALPPGGAPFAVGLLNTLRTAASVMALLVAGWRLQRTERRRSFIGLYALLTMLSLVAPALSASWTAMLVLALLGGAAWGVFSSVDLAILSHVLPSQSAAGRDLGLLGVAGAAPQLVAPALGAAVIAIWGYAQMFALAAGLTLLAGLLALRLRAVP
jgi:hypothetical protein